MSLIQYQMFSPFSNSGFLLVDRHDGRDIVGFSLPMLCAFLLFNTFLIPVFELVLDPIKVWEGRWKRTEKIINWLFWAEYFSNVILSLLGIFVGSSELLIHGDLSHLDLLTLSELSLQCMFTSTPFKCLLASCSWNFFSCPGVPTLLGPL